MELKGLAAGAKGAGLGTSGQGGGSPAFAEMRLPRRTSCFKLLHGFRKDSKPSKGKTVTVGQC